jgi:predicted ATPase with chaperone activity
VTKIYSVAGQLPGDTPFIHHRPFRAKHHTISFANQLKAGLVGGGKVPGPGEVRDHCPVDDAGRSLLRAAMQQLHMSARAYPRILKLARTIADPSTGSG